MPVYTPCFGPVPKRLAMKAMAAQEALLEKRVQAEECLNALLAAGSPPAARTRRAAASWRGRRLAAIRAAQRLYDDITALWCLRWELLWHKDMYLPATPDTRSIRLQLKVLSAFTSLANEHLVLTSLKLCGKRDTEHERAAKELQAYYRRLNEEAGNIDLLAEDSGPLSEEEEVSIDLLK